MQRKLNNTPANFALFEDPTTPSKITEWIGTLKLLVGVPLNYLIPDASILPPEAIRFFYLDPNWVESLVDGALSIGRATELDYKIDVLYSNNLHLQANTIAANHRANLFKKSRKLKTNDPVTNDDLSLITGFILRSAVVKDYPGLEITAYAEDQEQELKVYRLEKIAPDILLGTFIGELATLRIQQPAEALHFGVDVITADDQSFTKTLRNATDGKINEKQERVDFRPGNKQVIPIAKLADKMRTDLQLSEENFTSAEFALEMIESLNRIEFTFTKKE